MRMRKKKNLIPRMERCASWLCGEPAKNRGRWREAMGKPGAPFYVELGCGKGGFITKTAAANPDNIYLALERVKDALVKGLEQASESGLSNLRFISGDAAALPAFLADGEADGIFINFCDPWPRTRTHKRRLTHRGFLALYEKALSPSGALYFKTDNRELFEFSICELSDCGWTLSGVSLDLHASELAKDNITTEYEDKFSALGMPIYRLEARPHGGKKD